MSEIKDMQARTVLEDLISRLKSALGEDLVGIYLYGSLATDDFVEGLSDIDLLMVLKADVDHKKLQLLTSLHKQFNAEHKQWQKRIDVAYVSQDNLWDFQTKPYKAIISSEDAPLEIVVAPQYYLIDWYKIQEHGIALFGPKVSEVIPSIAVDEFRHTIHDYMLKFTEDVRKSEKRGQQAYVVLTLCRSLYAYVFAKHVSKKAGAQWAMTKYPQWHELIQKALVWSRNEAEDAIVDRENQNATIEFVDFMLSEAT